MRERKMYNSQLKDHFLPISLSFFPPFSAAAYENQHTVGNSIVNSVAQSLVVVSQTQTSGFGAVNQILDSSSNLFSFSFVFVCLLLYLTVKLGTSHVLVYIFHSNSTLPPLVIYCEITGGSPSSYYSHFQKKHDLIFRKQLLIQTRFQQLSQVRKASDVIT